MNMIKLALTGTAVLGLIVAGTAEAASTRSGAALPKVFVAKKGKVARSVAPVGNESQATITDSSTYWLAALAAVAAGTAGYFATRDNSGNIIAIDTPGG